MADGEAVLWARALLVLSLEAPRVYDDEATCGAERALSAKAPKNDYLSVYPNPASDHLTIRYDPTENGDQLLLIFNNLGQLVLSAWLPGDQDRIKIATGRLPAGIYWYHVAGDQQAPASGGFIIHR
ncbi:MAG: T9SS type A sorting domain-containing protein [Saprospirales bacterium]|nr:T9SS type A sorting domain-containing protein [Saprospirales bacterium]